MSRKPTPLIDTGKTTAAESLARRITRAAIIAAVYAVVSLLLAPLSYGPVQLRASEALCLLPVIMPEAVPGLFVGCAAANLISPMGLPDLILGSLATLLGALGTRALRKRKWAAALAPVLTNGALVGGIIYYCYGVSLPLWSCMLWVAAGEAIAVYGFGFPLLKAVERQRWLNRL